MFILWFRFSLVAILLTLFTNLYPQQQAVRFEHLTVDDGLSENAVTCLIQDSQSFIWIGTHGGLNKYDGYKFTSYTYDTYTSNTLSNNIILVIYEDKKGELWVGTLNGLNKFDRQSETFSRFYHNPQDPDSISNNKVQTILEDSFGNLWIGTLEGGLNLLDRETNTCKHFKHDPHNGNSLNSNAIMVILEDHSGTLFLGTNKGINTYDRQKGIFNRFPVRKETLGYLNNANISCMHEDSNHNLWIGAYGMGLFKRIKEQSTLTSYKHDPKNPQSLSSNEVMSVFKDSNGILWVGTKSAGLNQLVEDKGIFIRHSHNPRIGKSLSHNQVNDIFEDYSNILWVATLGGGLNRINRYKGKFEHYIHDSNDSNSLSSNFIYPIFEDSTGILWIGTSGGGLNRYSRNKNLYTHYQHDPNKPSSLCHNIVRSIVEDNSGFLWIATEGGLSRLKLTQWREKRFYNYHHDQKDSQSLSFNHVLSLLVDRSGVLWVGTSNGFDRFNRETGTFVHYTFNPEQFNANNVWTIFQDLDGIFWLGTWGQGFCRFDSARETFTNYPYNPQNVNGISHNIVTCFYEDKDKILWIGTYGGGLNRFNRAFNQFTHYTTNDGLADNVVYGILEDEEGHLWLSTNKGLSKFNPKTKTFRNYNKNDGLQSNEFNRTAYLKDRNGRFYFGGINGINAFYPHDIKDNPLVPPMAITSFRVFNQEIKLDWRLAQREGIFLTYNLNFFSFEFAALDFTSPERNQYAYMLEGIDNDWVYSNHRRYAAYTSINPGHYIFRVKGSNNDGVWNEEGIAIPITISPPFWQRWWFTVIWISLLGIIAFLIFYFTYRYITLLKEKGKAERFAAIGKFASYFAHDMKSPLEGTYLIASQVKDMLPPKDDKREYLDGVIGGLTRMRSLVKGALDFSRIRKPKMEDTDLNLLIKKAATEFQEAHACDVSLHLDGDLPMILLDSSLVKRIFFNLFQNSFQARKGVCQISVQTRQLEQEIMIEVSDKGKGIQKEILATIFEPFSSDKEEGYGFGLAFVKETVKSHGGTISVESETGEGATFFIKFPNKKENNKKAR
jgi:ligand-binding sensor domain-containing protein/signal transduction histidine kinase